MSQGGGGFKQSPQIPADQDPSPCKAAGFGTHIL